LRVLLAPVLPVVLAQREQPPLELEPEAPPQVRALPLGLVQVRVPEQQPREQEEPQQVQRGEQGEREALEGQGVPRVQLRRGQECRLLRG
jgi:hypothetical protein